MTQLDRREYAAVIVGAGIIGLLTAHHLAARGVGPILVVDQRFLSGGASGRNGGGVRQQWETPSTVRLARESVDAYRHFGRDFGYNVWFRQSGYLFLAASDAELRRLEVVHNNVVAAGLPGRILRGAEELKSIAPKLSVDGLVGGTFLESDGTLYPFPAVWGAYSACRRQGVEVALKTAVTGIERSNDRVTGVATSEGTVATRVVVDAAGGWSADVARLAGLDVANRATRHEILATEPLKPFLDPMVVRVSDGLYFSQTMRGEIVGGLTLPHPPGTSGGMPSSATFLRTMSRELVRLVPALASLGVLRAWSGFYDDTPDGLPVIGEDPRLHGFVHANGFGGHGFMLAPAAAKRVAAVAAGERTDLDPNEFGPGRFLDPERASRREGLQLG